MKTSESAARTLGSLMQRVADVSGKMAKDVDLKRENANVDGDVAMGQMLRFGSETAKAYYLNYLIDPKFAEAHLNGDIHIHDLDFYAMTTTCCQIDLLKLLSKGFSTGHGSLREPQTIGSAAALACIAIQSNQNDQHGGQSIPNFDYGLAPYVEKSFRRNYMDALIGVFEGALTGKNALHYVANGVKHIFEDLESSGGVLSVDEDSCVMFCQTEELNSLVTTVGHCEISRQKVEELRGVAWNNATQRTYRETYQAMEALIHNLNTMHSRAGAQVPFSSINYGTDTSAAGRMVTECILLALEAGLGNGETPIFPIHIFRVKEGVNFNEGDKNYDLFQLACKVSAKRLFPNFSFQDAPYNLKYYEAGRPETEISYMGCIGGAEVVTYRIDEGLFVESAERFWKRVAETNDVKTFGVSEYIDVDNVEIYDSSSDGFVKVNRLVKNPDKGDWTRVTFENGRSLYLTEDHALPVKGKGRTLVRDMKLGDAVPAAGTLEPLFLKLTKIEKLGTLGESSYCVETESDRFDVSGINSHNCRTRVIGNVYDPENEIAFSRGNLSFTSINLPRLAIEFVANRIQAATTEDAREIFAEDMKLQEKFVGEVLAKLDLCVEQLLERFALQSARTARNFPFLIQQGCWLDGEKLRLDEQVGEILKHGTLSVGFIGLAETLTCLFGRHHGESLESQAFGLYLITKMRDALDAYSRKMKLNFTLLATPAEGLSGRFVKLDRKRYGEIKGVTDKEFYTNSFHIPVDYQISINDKISLEAPYHELTNAGHITYVEVDGDISQNPRAFEKIIRRMKELGVGYGAINHPVDRDPVCGYDGVIEDACPRCGRKETQDQPFERIRRITGYLVGTLARFNDAKRAEESQRVKHQSYGR